MRNIVPIMATTETQPLTGEKNVHRYRQIPSVRTDAQFPHGRARSPLAMGQRQLEKLLRLDGI